MKSTIKIIAFCLLFLINYSESNAQLNGALNKAKDKAKEKLTENKSEIKTESKPDIEKPIEMKIENSTGTRYEKPYQGTDYSGTHSIPISEILESEYKWSPYTHIRKLGETSTAKYLKDYPELHANMEVFENDMKVEFFDALPNSGAENFSQSFTSQQHIYARITATNGTIKDVFHFDENNAYLYVKMYLYDDVSQKISYTSRGYFNFIRLTKEEANLSSLDIEILGHNMKYNLFKSDDGGMYMSPFPNMHKESNFPRNGKYKVGFFLFTDIKDDWGKAKEGEGYLHGNTFEYDFSAKDVAQIEQDQTSLHEAKKNGVKYEKKALPPEWDEKSSAFTMGYTEKQIIDLYKSCYTGSHVMTIVKCFAHPSNGGWSIQKNEYGIPEYRYSNQFYTLFTKHIDGSCYYQRFSLRQRYSGGGTYDSVFGDITYQVYFTDCEKMK